MYIVIFNLILFAHNSQDMQRRLEKLTYWTNSIAVHTYNKQTKSIALIAFVGTHKDEVVKLGSMEIFEEISEKLEDTFGCNIDLKVHYWVENFFNVDNNTKLRKLMETPLPSITASIIYQSKQINKRINENTNKRVLKGLSLSSLSSLRCSKCSI